MVEEQQEEQRSGKDRHGGDSEIIEHVKAADTAIELVRRWGTIIAIVIGFGWTLRSYDSGVQQVRTGQMAQEKALDDFKVEVRGRFDQIGGIASKASGDAHDLQLRYEQLNQALNEERRRGETRDIQMQKYGEWIEGQKALQSRR